jgi:DNA-directed RNA polymerase III subunit RPC2
VETDQEVVQLVGSEPYYADMMSSSLEESCRLQVFTQAQALEFIGNRVTQRQQRKPKPKAEEARNILASVILSHVPVVNYDFHVKAIYVGLVIRRILLAMRDPSTMDDKDYYGNKRLELYNPPPARARAHTHTHTLTHAHMQGWFAAVAAV